MFLSSFLFSFFTLFLTYVFLNPVARLLIKSVSAKFYTLSLISLLLSFYFTFNDYSNQKYLTDSNILLILIPSYILIYLLFIFLFKKTSKYKGKGLKGVQLPNLSTLKGSKGLLIVFVTLFFVISLIVTYYLNQPKNYDECILDNIGKAKTKHAVHLVNVSCRKIHN